MKLINWTIFVLILSGCSMEKRISKAVKRLGAKDVATHIAIEYPEYLRADTVRLDVVRHVPIEVIVPELVHDTIFRTDTVNDCKAFNYSDKWIWFNVSEKRGKTKVDYNIKTRSIATVQTVTITENVPCPPCPTIDVVQNAKSYYERKEIVYLNRISFYKRGFFALLLLVLTYIGWRIAKIYFKISIPF